MVTKPYQERWRDGPYETRHPIQKYQVPIPAVNPEDEELWQTILFFVESFFYAFLSDTPGK